MKVGDIIVELDGKPISHQVVQEYLQKTKIGDQVRMKVKREGAILELTGKAMVRPGQPLPTALPYEVEFNGERLDIANMLGKHFRRGGPSCCTIVSAADLIKLSSAMKAGRIVKPETLRLHTDFDDL